MNPSHYTQMIRSRSRSPSPTPRRRASDAGVRSEEVSVEENNLLFVPENTVHVSRVRSHSAAVPHKSHHRHRHHCELNNMASVEIVNAYHTISDSGLRRAVSHPDPEEADNDPNPGPDVIFSSHHGSINNSCDSNPTTPSDGCSGTGGRAQGRGDACMGSCTPSQVDQLRRRVKFFFMDPYSKFKARRHIPWKMFLQLLKIIFITIQLVQFGGQRSEVVSFFESNAKTLKHLLLKNWDPSFETMPYPPATGDYALYTTDNLLGYIDHAWKEYHNLSHTSLATINLLKSDVLGKNQTVPMRLCNSFNDYIDFLNGTYLVGPGVIYNCTDLIPLEGKDPYNIRQFMLQNNFSIPFHKLVELTLSFTFDTFDLNLLETHYGPTCYRVDAVIEFSNKLRSGQVLIYLRTTNSERPCSGKIMSPAAEAEEVAVKRKSVAFDSSVIIVCCLSTLLCVRSLCRALSLKRKVEELFRDRYGKKLDFSDRMEFVNLWYFLIIVNDICTIFGAAYKIQLETRIVTITSYNYVWCSLALGLGGLMAWIGCLRYLNFFKKYNILILTLKKAFPNMLRFMVCALAMYFGFMFCGWVILSPYHIKFRHLSSTSECLYSLVNGDDMFVTFSATQTTNNMVWYFSRAYLYIFISLFIYCVLSLFISVIMDTYETLKDYYEHGFPKSELQKFMEQCNDPLHSGLYRRQHTEDKSKDFSLIECFAACCCRKKSIADEPGERTSLLSRTI